MVQGQYNEEVLNNTRLGTLLVQQRQITEIQLANALREHLLTDRRLGDILVDHGLVPRSVIDHYSLKQHQLRHLFDNRENFYRESSQLGFLLAETQLVSPEVISSALAEQERSGARLGDILVEQGHISRTALNEVLTLQKRFRRTAISAMLSLVTSLVAMPQVNSANLTATGQIGITLRFTDQRRPVFLESPERFRENENVDLTLDAGGKIHRLAMRLDETELRLEVNSDDGHNTQRGRPQDGQELSLDEYQLNIGVERQGERGDVMSISLSPT